MKRLLIALLSLIVLLPVSAQDSPCADGFRLIEHALGETCVPENPQRIIALDPFTFETMVALDLPIVATPAIYVDELTGKFPQFGERLSDVVDTGIPINIERLLEAEPDVILCRQTACDSLYEQLSAIAPTVFFDNSGAVDWRESARFFAEVVGHGEALAEVEATFDARLDNLRDAITADFNRPPTVSVLRIRPEQLRLYFEDSFPWAVLSAVGFTSPEGQSDVIAASTEQFGSPRLANISLEQIPVIDADYVFAFTTDGLTPGDAQDYLAELQENLLWQALDVVREDRLYIVDNNWFGTGYIAAHAIIDDLYAVVTGVGPEIANPFNG
ncbi:MAG: iron-siderophore ABC transporter substrate-binding protein [Chloroflexi bacterium]|nr:iron-siderophore ABC transporter substrate-binding protein [Chloroflexota bacterium]